MIEVAGIKPAKAKTLNASQKHETVYCVPLHIRDDQIRSNNRRIAGRVQEGELNAERIAIVGFGSSLRKTYRALARAKYKHIVTVSGAHKFLLDHGFSPDQFENWYHVEVDPREHKLQLLGEPRKGIQYLPASCCHPLYTKAIVDAGCDIKLWHVFGRDGESDIVIPRGEWKIFGGTDVGMRAMTIARFLGYRDQHIYGLDGCLGPEGLHAAEHPNQPKDYRETEVNGKNFKTTISLLESAKQVFHELNQMPDVTVKFYGRGLTQEMAKTYVRQPPTAPLLAEKMPELITPEFCSLNRQLHEENAFFGSGGARHAAMVKAIIKQCKYKSILDYGCGKANLSKALEFPIWNYDPAVPEYSTPPRPAELVVCTDVLEHIEPECLDAVLLDLRRVTLMTIYMTIHLGKARKSYADGRNTHLIIQPPEWWKAKLGQHFKLELADVRGNELLVVAGRK